MNNDLLSFLVEDLDDRQRDVVTRAFYKFAESDPESGPVNEAVLLTACARLVAQAPKNMRLVLLDLKKLLLEGRDMEARIWQRAEASNGEVVAVFKDEAARATSSLRATAQHTELIVTEGRQIADTTRQLLAQSEWLLQQLRLISEDLAANREFSRNNRAVIASIKDIVASLTDAARMNSMTVGMVTGFILAVLALQLPAWLAVPLFVLSVALLQWIGRMSWQAVLTKAEALKMR